MWDGFTRRYDNRIRSVYCEGTVRDFGQKYLDLSFIRNINVDTITVYYTYMAYVTVMEFRVHSSFQGSLSLSFLLSLPQYLSHNPNACLSFVVI